MKVRIPVSHFAATSLVAIPAAGPGSPLAWPQAQISGSLRGVVTDSAGAAVPNATLHLVNPGDGSDRPTAANG